MASTTQHDFTSGNTLKQLVVFSGPIIIANLLQSSFQLVDSLWVGNLLGAQALGAVAVSAVLMFTVLSFVLGMNNAALAILSQQKGRQDEDGLRRYLNAFVVLMGALSIVLGVAGFFGAELLLRLMGTPEALLNGAREYLQISFLGMLFLFGYNFLSTVLRSLGDSRTPMRFVFVAVVLNIGLDPLFIHVLGLGIRGAALATVLSQGLAFSAGLTYVLVRRLAPVQVPRPPSWVETRTIMKLGIPSGLQMAVISAGSAAIMSVVTGFGGDVVGGFGAAQRIDSLIMMPAQALGIAVSSMAGQNIGSGNWPRVARIAKVAVAYNLVVMFSIAALVVLFAEPLVRLFLQEPDAVEFATRYVRTVAFFYPFLGINFVLNGVVRASGAMFQVLVLNIISFWVLRYPLTALFAHLLGSDGIGVGIGVSLVISSGFAFAYYRFGRWRGTELFDASR